MSRREDSRSDSVHTTAGLAQDVDRAVQALELLRQTRGPDLPRSIALLVEAVATEAARTARFSTALQRALVPAHEAVAGGPEPARSRHAGRRNRGTLDPFAVYVQGSEEGLRVELAKLTLEQLRDIVAEHGMDHDRLALKWKDRTRVIDRIIERVTARSAKGSAFRDDDPPC